MTCSNSSPNKRPLIGGLALALLISLLLACGKATPTPLPVQTSLHNTPLPTATPLPTDAPPPTRTAAPTSTPLPGSIPSLDTPTLTHALPPTATPLPTNTPTPTATSAPTFTPEVEPDKPPAMESALLVSTHTLYTDTMGAVHVVGQVYNGGQKNVRWVKVKGSFYDKDKVLLAQEETYAYIDVLRPEEKAPFDLMLQKPTCNPGCPDLDTYDLEASGSETTEEPFLGIQFVQHNASLQEDDLTIVGEVINVSERPASQARIAGAVYDADGNVLDVGFTYVEQDVLEPEAIAPFKLYISDIGGTPENYHIVAYGQEAEEFELEDQAHVEILSTSYYKGKWDNLVVIGEVRNADTTNAAYIQVYASFYDEDDKLVAVGSSYVWRDILKPGERSPFEIDLFDAQPHAVGLGIDHWTIGAYGSKSGNSPQGDLALEDVVNAVNEKRVIAFTGNVKNNGQETMTRIEVGVTIYGLNEKVVAVGRAYLAGDLAPGATKPFELSVQATGEADTFQLYVQGEVKE